MKLEVGKSRLSGKAIKNIIKKHACVVLNSVEEMEVRRGRTLLFCHLAAFLCTKNATFIASKKKERENTEIPELLPS